MTEPSPEAVVASEAAANAVEELHAREEVDQAATEAVVIADVAVGQAQEAALRAEEADSTAAVAVAISENAAENAETAIEQNQALAYATAEAFDAFCAAQDEKMRGMREYIDSRIPLPTVQPETPEVEEVEVHGADVSNSGRQSESSPSSESNSSGSAAEKQRYGLKHRKSKR